MNPMLDQEAHRRKYFGRVRLLQPLGTSGLNLGFTRCTLPSVSSTETYAAALAAAEAELEATLQEYRQVQLKVSRLQQAVQGLRRLLRGDGPAEDGTAHHHQVVLNDTAMGADSLAVGVEAPRSSTDRVVAIVNQAGRPMRFSEIIREFQRRGWVESRWESPEATIRTAARRAKRQGRIDRAGDGAFLPRSRASATVGGQQALDANDETEE
jgi:hypothetical protein